jgi:predicted nucleic acid-binding protein
MKILFDTNTVLDLLLDREPFVHAIASLFSMVERGDLQGCLCATTITTLYYLASKAVGRKKATLEIQNLLNLFEIAPVNHSVLQAAVQSGFPDFEDGVVVEASRFIGADGIVTRDMKGFKKSSLPIYSPLELLSIIADNK